MANGTPTYSSGIQAGPVWSGGQLNSALGQAQQQSQASPFRQPAGMPPMSPAQQQAIEQQHAGLMGSQYQQGQVGLQRGAAQANAAQTLASEQARASSGIAGGNFLQTLAEQNWRTQQPIYSWGLNQLLSQAG